MLGIALVCRLYRYNQTPFICKKLRKRTQRIGIGPNTGENYQLNGGSDGEDTYSVCDLFNRFNIVARN